MSFRKFLENKGFSKDDISAIEKILENNNIAIKDINNRSEKKSWNY